jgi:hypothetical protein
MPITWAWTTDVQTVFALIFCYLVFSTRTWQLTRLVCLADFGFAILYDFTPLRLHIGYFETIVLALTFVLWLVNIVADRPKADA